MRRVRSVFGEGMDEGILRLFWEEITSLSNEPYQVGISVPLYKQRLCITFYLWGSGKRISGLCYKESTASFKCIRIHLKKAAEWSSWDVVTTKASQRTSAIVWTPDSCQNYRKDLLYRLYTWRRQYNKLAEKKKNEFRCSNNFWIVKQQCSLYLN